MPTNKILPNQLQAMKAQTQLDHICALEINSESSFIRQSGIVCTIGPVTRDVQMLEKMIETGMNIARLNFSHGSHEYHAETIKNIRAAQAIYSKKIGTQYPLAIALDTKGPEVRTGSIEGGPSAEVQLKQGNKITLTTDKSYLEKGNATCVYINCNNIHKMVSVGTQIFIDDNTIELTVSNIQGDNVICTIMNGGMLGGKKGVKLVGVRLNLPPVSEDDRKDILFGVEHEVDMIFHSFVGSKAVVDEIRNVLGEKGKDIYVVAKIENLEGMKHMSEIIHAADGILIDRGDLSSEVPNERIFLAQKAIISHCNNAGKPVICATQLLDSMIEKPRPTRAESSDVANAILDGADCVMLSGETAKGEYPLECVKTMADICKEAEAAIWQKQLFAALTNKVIPPLDASNAMAIASVEASINCMASAIICISSTGGTAHLLSKYRPKCPIIAVTRHKKVAAQAHLFRGIYPVYYTGERLDTWAVDGDARITYGIVVGKSRGLIKNGDNIVIVTGWKESTGYTSAMRVVTVGSDNTMY